MRALLLVLTLSPAVASATEWDVLVHVGLGRLFGAGSDINRITGAFAVSGGPRVLDELAIRAHLELDLRRFRHADSLDRAFGVEGVFAVGPYYIPFDGRVQPFAGALVGVAYSLHSLEEGSDDTDVRARHWVLGGSVGALVEVNDQFALGLDLLALPRWVDKACIRTDVVACDTETRGLTVIGASHLVLETRL